ncbi:MAG: hypothetical protein U5K43_03090 [Halofilum sp. (in: g-proteobacteria)]|nr:hypothetical protein [Halofilum sp. (in: g-proteobacteria)]
MLLDHVVYSLCVGNVVPAREVGEHRLNAQLVMAIGPAYGVIWDDRGSADPGELGGSRAGKRRLPEELRFDRVSAARALVRPVPYDFVVREAPHDSAYLPVMNLAPNETCANALRQRSHYGVPGGCVGRREGNAQPQHLPGDVSGDEMTLQKDYATAVGQGFVEVLPASDHAQALQ